MSIPGPLLQIWRSMINGKGFDRCLKQIQLISAADGLCKAEMTVAEEHTNKVGTLHGGLTSTIVDVVSGIALASHKSNPKIGVSVDLHISFASAAQIGEQIIIECKTNKAGKTLAFLDVWLTSKESGKLIAKGSHTKFIA